VSGAALATVPDVVLRDNVRFWYAAATRRERLSGLRWYRTAHGIARDLYRTFDLPSLAHGAGILAALSPATSWDVNVRDAFALCGSDLAVVSTYGANRKKALAIRRGENPHRVLGASLNSGDKVRAFFYCIAAPSRSLSVCLDRHAVSAALGAVTDPSVVSALLRRKGQYERFADAYAAVAVELGLMPHQVQAVVWLAWRRHKVEHRALLRAQRRTQHAA
jgi:hypothetical protein